MKSITILGGKDKDGRPETIAPLTLLPGELYSIIGNTGSGKSRLIKDVEQLVNGDSVTARRILLDGSAMEQAGREEVSGCLVAHLGQNMRFVLDISVMEFISLHCRCREREHINPEAVLIMANDVTPEPIRGWQNLNMLSGGQTRALMIADIAMVCDSPVVLIDEIENAGINKGKALSLLTSREKLVLIVTHDPHTALMAPRRITMENGAIRDVVERSTEEETLFEELESNYNHRSSLQELLRKGEHLS